LIFVILAVLLSPALTRDSVGGGRDGQARTIPDLARAFSHTFSQILTPEEYELYTSRTPEEIRAIDNELYRKINQNVGRWTDDWILWAARNLDTVPEKRLQKAMATASRIDGLARSYFEGRGWSYRSLRVVFLPQRLFHDARDRESRIRGVFIPFYPEVFFSTVDPSAPLELVILHENIHYNKRGRSLGRPLNEGITETAARHIVILHELLPSRVLRDLEVYPRERKLVETIVREIMAETGSDHDAALDLLLAAYLTGDQSEMERIFGEDSWTRVIELSRSERKWHKLRSGVEAVLD
jgi:hypothetical protein